MREKIFYYELKIGRNFFLEIFFTQFTMYESELETNNTYLVLTHATNIPSNKYQHLLLFIALENAPSTSL